jgi:hypothetical protein
MENPIELHRNEVIKNIYDSFEKSVESQEFEVYSEKSIENFYNDLSKAWIDGNISLDEFEKGKKDLSRLAMRQIIDKNGHKKVVYVKVHEDEHGKTHEISHVQKSNDRRKLNKTQA